MKILHLLLLLVAIGPACFSQTLPLNQTEVNEIFAKIRSNPNDTVKVDLIWQLGRYQLAKTGDVKINLDSGLAYYQYSLRFCDSAHLKLNHRYESLCRIGEAYFRLSKIGAGKAAFMEVIKAYQHGGDKGREARTWARLATTLEIGDPGNPEMPVFFLRALKLYRELGNKKKEGDVLYETGKYYAIMLKMDSAERIILLALNAYKAAGFNNLSVAYYSLSLLYRNKGNLNKSLFYAIQCVDNCVLRKDTLNVYTTPTYYGQLGLLYSDLKNNGESILNYKVAIRMSLKRSPKNVAPDLTYFYTTELVRSYLLAHQPKKALAEINYILTKYPPADQIQTGHAAEMLGQYYEASNQFDLAEKQYLKMVRYYKGTGPDEPWGYKVLGTFYLQQKKYAQAKNALKSQFINFPSIVQSFLSNVQDEEFYYRIDSANGDMASALKHYIKFKTLSDSAYNIMKSKQIQELQIQYKTVQKENDIKLLKDEGLVQKNNAERADNMRNLTLAAVALLVLFIGLLYNSYRFKQRKNDELNQLVSEKDKLLIEKDDLLIEKEWLLKEIHHRVKNNLQIVMGLLQRQSAYIDNDVALAAIQNSENRLHSISLIHQKLYQSDSLDLIYMPDYIDEFIGYLKGSFDLGNRILFEKTLDGIYLDVSQAVPLGLILNEAVTNAVKYAYPGEQTGIIQISLTRLSDEENLLIVQDFGRGLSAEFTLEKIDSMGMNLMRGLSKQIGGRFEVSSYNGVRIAICFKVENFFGVNQPDNTVLING